MATVQALTIYPVKSLRGIAVDQARLTAEGLAFDRRWMVTTASGQFLTQRQCTAMATIGTALDDAHLILSDERGSVLRIPLERPLYDADPVVIFGQACRGVDEGDEAGRWLTSVLGEYKGETLRLKRVPSDNQRRVEPAVLGETVAYTGFADAYPLLVGSASSLAELNERLQATQASPVPIERFRTNILVEGAEAFAEHRQLYLRHDDGDYALRLCKPCKRCKITTVDQRTGMMPEPKEPLRTLATMAHVNESGAFFGENAIIEAGSDMMIRVGDEVRFDVRR